MKTQIAAELNIRKVAQRKCHLCWVLKGKENFPGKNSLPDKGHIPSRWPLPTIMMVFCAAQDDQANLQQPQRRPESLLSLPAFPVQMKPGRQPPDT